MQLNKTNWIVKIAYLFTGTNDEIPAQVDRCTLWQRFCVLLVPWMIINIFAWFSAVLVLGIIAQPLVRTGALLFVGKKLYFKPVRAYGQPSSIVGHDFLLRLSVLSYKYENIWWLNWTDTGTIRCPILMVGGICFALGMFALGVRALPGLIREIGSNLAYVGSNIYHTAGWWGTPILAVLVLALLWYVLRRWYKAFAATPSGGVVVSHFKEWKQQHCTIIELV